ncbi:uncharacterized protein JN550_012548 [Neoarthrinium moseri]|uniref:uncharacterized protein n=1 Tax=Neoarthrinium moseri TaxID=1658444 RepID=UPI001FDB00E1|nr:uncharacterized protein JN550_012548 [Neoarthrinium moseri]KAI1858716.1 hypothetical protein JN550_012548 [Neoarthrinium moseri]
MSTSEELFLQYEGQVVPRSFNGGFVTLSYLVSFIGAASTLELINRRTSRNGLFNHLILLSAAITMGGIAIWCMHFIGNRAIDLGGGQSELQIVYSGGFTALSFFIPIMVLLAAFLAVGTNNRVSWWRIVVGGSLAGVAICGMHYLGNASIYNYTCVYNTVNVAGSALIAVAASIVSLALFFVFRASWTNSWWKRGGCAIVLAGAVSGMHWCASTGTQYRLVRLNADTDHLSRNTTVIVVICLSVGAALIMAGTAVYSTHVRRRYAIKAQQVVLAAAVFDRTGRILVNPDGLLPSEKITDTYIEKTSDDQFSISHPLFHWMFQASRNWRGLESVIDNMTTHLALLRQSGGNTGVRLIDDDGQHIANYDVILRELFCLAASNLASKTKEHIANVGTLWDEILPTGVNRSRRQRRQDDSDGDILAEKGDGWRAKHEYGRGSLMFLVRRLENARDVEKLEAAGFRFAEVNQVAGIIGSSMQIKTRNLSSKLNNMAVYAEGTMMEPGVHVGFFGLRARVGGFGFDVLVRRGARNLLPSMPMAQEHVESWQLDFLQQLDRLTIPSLCQKLDNMKKSSPREMLFASQLYDTVEALRAWVDDPIFDEAAITAKVVQIPCRARENSSSPSTCTLITLKMVIPIHVNIQSPRCEFVPLSLFKVHQLVYKDSPHHADFSRSVHREIKPIVNDIPLPAPSPAHKRPKRTSFHIGFRGFRRPRAVAYPVDADGNPIPTEFGRKLGHGSTHSSSTLKLWNGPSNEVPCSDGMSDRFAPRREESQPPSSFGGIMVSQEIKVDVRQATEVGTAGGRFPMRQQVEPGPKSNQIDGKPVAADRVTVVSAGHKRANMSKSGIEMKAISDGRGDIHSGPTTARSAVVESGRAGEASTFVDELFSICMDGR